MGGGYTVSKKVSVGEIHRTLVQHLNFEIPQPPLNATPKQAAEFILESVARYLSPPKIKDEDNEFECLDIANAIRTKLGPELLNILAKTKKR